MATSSVIGALRVVLGLDTASYEDGLKKAKTSADAFSLSFGKLASAHAVGELLADGIKHLSDVFIEGIKHSLEFADTIGKTAQKVGIPVEELSKLRVAAELSDLSLETLSKGLGILSKNMAAVASGGGADAAATFKTLGIEVTNSSGKLRSASDVLLDLSKKFSGSEDGAAKTAAAMNLLGKAGKDFIPFLNEGAESLKKISEQAEHFGLVVGKDFAERSQKFNDNMKLLKLAAEGFALQVTDGLLPALVSLSDQFIDTASKSDLIKSAAERTVNAIRAVVTLAYQAYTANLILGQAYKALQDALAATGDDFEAAGQHYQRAKDLVGSLSGELDKAAETIGKSFLRISVGGHQVKESLDTDLTGKIAKSIEDLGFKTDVLKGKFANLPAGFPELAKGLGVSIEAIGKAAVGTATQIDQLALAQANLKGAQITEEFALPWQKLAERISQLQVLLNAGSIDWATYQRASQKAADETGQSWQAASKSISDSFSEAANAFGDSQSQIVKTAKVLHAAQALIATYAGAAEALAGPFPANLVAAASVLAKGLVLVASIRGVGIGFKEGGSFKVGGSGGADSQLIQFMATPGEMVDVKTPAQAATATTSSGSGPQEIVLRGRRMTDLMTLDDLRTLTERLNSANRDGYKLKFAS